MPLTKSVKKLWKTKSNSCIIFPSTLILDPIPELYLTIDKSLESDAVQGRIPRVPDVKIPAVCASFPPSPPSSFPPSPSSPSPPSSPSLESPAKKWKGEVVVDSGSETDDAAEGEDCMMDERFDDESDDGEAFPRGSRRSFEGESEEDALQMEGVHLSEEVLMTHRIGSEYQMPNRKVIHDGTLSARRRMRRLREIRKKMEEAERRDKEEGDLVVGFMAPSFMIIFPISGKIAWNAFS